MEKLAPWTNSVARVVIVGLLAFALAVQGVAASARVGLAPVDPGLCAADGGGPHRHGPAADPSCSCCIPCRSGPTHDLAAVVATATGSAVFPLPIAGARRLRSTFAAVAASPPGWIGSWSQRAPPPSSSL
jgi:hypothetical protein